MEMFRASERDRKHLTELPESGMGYQIINVSGELFVVFNATVMMSLPALLETPFTAEDYEFLTGDPDGEKISSLRVRDVGGNFYLTFNDFDPEFRKSQVGLAFNRNAIQPGSGIFFPNRPHSFYRFSPFYKDKRVDRSGFKAGTYATTFNDLHFAPSGFVAVGRYALPNPASAKFVFPIVTFNKPDLMGTATPNYGQAGGGVEVYFRSAAQNANGCSFTIDAG